MLTPYCTVRNTIENEIVIQKSRFLTLCQPVASEKDIQALLAARRKRYWDASHHCYAYALGSDASIARYSDDGEPGGTAGLPMMEVLKAKQLADIVVIVTRYFGGTLLGAGGLVRAYSRSTSEAVGLAGIVTMLPSDALRVTMDYSMWSRLQSPLEKAGVLLEEPEYMQDVSLRIWVRQSEREEVIQSIIRWSDGRVEPRYDSTQYMAWDAPDDKNA